MPVRPRGGTARWRSLSLFFSGHGRNIARGLALRYSVPPSVNRRRPMPELPEVETVVRGLRPRLEGHVLAQVEQRCASLRFPFPAGFARRLRGRRVLRIDRRAKYILLRLDGDEVLLCHLGMSGRMVVTAERDRPLAKHDHVVFTTEAGDQVRFNDARRFGVMDLVAGFSFHCRAAGFK